MIKDVLKNKVIVAFSVLVVLSAIINVFMYQSASEKLQAAKKDAAQTKKELSISTEITSTYEQLMDREASLKKEYEEICQLFPKEVTQENTLNILKNLSDNASLNITNITFDKVEPMEGQSATNLSVKFSFKGSYKAISNFINELNTYKQKISLQQISFDGFFSQLKGNATVVLHGYNNSIVSLVPPTSSSLTGKEDLFQLFLKAIPFAPQNEAVKTSSASASAALMQNNSNVLSLFETTKSNYDVYIVLNKASDDAPNVIVGKYKQSEITADGNQTNWVNIQFYEEDGRFGYRYRTDSDVYPDNVSVEEFIPIDKNTLRVHVFSSAIDSINDKSRLLLSVYNDTTKKVQITVTGADGKTRVMKNRFNGDVELRYE